MRRLALPGFFCLSLGILLAACGGPQTAPPTPRLGLPDEPQTASPKKSFSEDDLYFTLNPDAPLKGPIWDEDGDAPSRRAYVREIFRTLLSEAARLKPVKDLRESGVDPAYYAAFLLGSLAVPYQESGVDLIHFRKISPLGNRCNKSRNSGAWLRHISHKSDPDQVTSRWFDNMSAEKSSRAAFIPPCPDFDPALAQVQLVGSSDYFSVGLMQVALLFHPDYVDAGDYFDVKKTVAYGLKLFDESFMKIWGVPKNHYECLYNKASDDDINPLRLIRAAWGSGYNGGYNPDGSLDEDRVCRFNKRTGRQARYHANDVVFAGNLKVLLGGGPGSAYGEYLTGRDARIFWQIVAVTELKKTDLTEIDEYIRDAQRESP